MQNKFNSFVTKDLLDKIFERVYKSTIRFNGRIAAYGMDSQGKYILGNGGGWVDSFWIGILNLAFAYNGDKKFINAASVYQPFFKERVENDPEVCKQKNYLPLDHDTGFIFTLSEISRYKLTGDTEAKELALAAAKILAGRFHEKGSFIRAFDKWPWETERDSDFIEEKKGKMIIDSMMNMPLLMWAYQETNNEEYKRVAISHAYTVKKYIIRADYSTYHQFNFNPETGEPIKGVTGQGFADESCWSRGQSWAIYGFALMYGYTGEKEFLDAAVKLAKYFIERLGPVFIPPWDFNAIHLNYVPWDSSAGAIASSGILEICKYVDDRETKEYLKNAADKMLHSLLKLCSTIEVDFYEPILLHACAGPAFKSPDCKTLENGYTDLPVAFGDYFYIEALLKLYDSNIKLFWI